ncbi:hypothetical protein LMH73_017085 [Vibrio splendidus]|nr:hypothetical protein [Vibrio splendidus]MCC4880546.1 hypothetical protein [Vibrio splendidus]
MKIGDTVHALDCTTNTIIKTGTLNSVTVGYFTTNYVIDGEAHSVSMSNFEQGTVVISDVMRKNLIIKGARKYSDAVNVRCKFMLDKLDEQDYSFILDKLQEIDNLLEERSTDMGLTENIHSYMRIWGAKNNLPEQHLAENIESHELKKEAKSAIQG